PVHSSTPDRPKSGEQGFSAHDLCACLLLRQAEGDPGSPGPPVAAVSQGHSVHRLMPAFQPAEAVVAASVVAVAVASVPHLPDALAPARELLAPWQCIHISARYRVFGPPLRLVPEPSVPPGASREQERRTSISD